jgi:16S rRNA (cytosine1402-N4)-methyltransferase
MNGHLTVLRKEALHWLAPRPAGWWGDLTVGGGGHTEALLQATAPAGRVLGLDRDESVLATARERLAEYAERLLLVHADFRDLRAVAAAQGITGFSGILLDLGVSSFQLEDAARGFSFRREGPLDMRMDRTQELTAAELVNHADEEELAEIFSRYGEERRARTLARMIVDRRPLHTTLELAELARRAVGRAGRIHPATRAFQALRIAVNDELGALEQVLTACAELLKTGGRLVVISFHSLEDRRVKQFLRAGGWEILNRHVIRPGEAECAANPRARSARLRAAARR